MSVSSLSSLTPSEEDHSSSTMTGHRDVTVSVAAEPEVSPTDESGDNTDMSNNDTRGRSNSRRHMRGPSTLTRKPSGTIIVPRDGGTYSHTEAEEYPPGDARAMSPRRNSEETDAMEQEMRAKMRLSARETQLTLLEIAESIELVRQSHNQLQRQNEMLQDYIGGLTRSMAQPGTRSGKAGKK